MKNTKYIKELEKELTIFERTKEDIADEISRRRVEIGELKSEIIKLKENFHEADYNIDQTNEQINKEYHEHLYCPKCNKCYTLEETIKLINIDEGYWKCKEKPCQLIIKKSAEPYRIYLSIIEGQKKIQINENLARSNRKIGMWM